MKHGNSKTKFGSGHDANKMLTRKLVYNFFRNGKLETTETKVKAIKPVIEKLVTKLKTNTQANRNFVLSYIPNAGMVDELFTQVGPAVQNRPGGYLRHVRLEQRISDGAVTARLQWVDPVVIEYKDVPTKRNSAVKTAEKKEEVKETKPAVKKTKAKAKTEAKTE